MPDDYTTLYNRLLNRAPDVGVVLSQQLINDSWRTIQAHREWSFRRRNATFAPPTQYNTGFASTNVLAGNPNLITGVGTGWTADMVGRQIRVGGLLYPYYDIVGYQSSTALIIGQPWAGPDVVAQAYQILQCYYPVPTDFGYMYAVVSIKDSYRLWTNLTESDLAVLDPQRTNQGQTYAAVFRDYTSQLGGTVGPVIPVTSPTDPAPISTTSTGYTYVANATYVVQVVAGGASGTATFQWLRSGQVSFTGPITTSTSPITLADGVQIYWPVATYVTGDLFVINCVSIISQTAPRYELWPAPSFDGYLYPYIYTAKEYDLSVAQPQLPPFMANRGEVILELALSKAAEFPGTLTEPNPYHDLRQAKYHYDKYSSMLDELSRNDEEVGVSLIDYEMYPFAPAPWETGQWQQRHAPFLG